MAGFTTNATLTRARRLASDVVLCTVGFFAVTILPALQTVGPAALYRAHGPLLDLALYAAIAAACLAAFGSYRMIWRYVSFKDLLTLTQAITVIVAVFFALEIFLLHPHARVPLALVAWSAGFVWIGALVFLSAPRFVARAVGERHLLPRLRWEHDDGPMPILLSGEPHRSDAFIRDCLRDGDPAYRVVGVFTDDRRLQGSNLNGVEVLGPIENFPSMLSRLQRRNIHPKMLVLADDNAGREKVEHLLDLTSGTDLKVGRLPRLGTLSGESTVFPVALSDLLGRPEIAIDAAAVESMIRGKCIFITGAGGSIGSELTRQVAALGPSRIVIADASEFNLYSIDRELEEKWPELEREPALLDVRDGALVASWIRRTRPNVVFHAAALKHVPLLEDHPIEAAKTNVFGTMNVADACRANGVAAMVTVSTDKAVNPCNVMGATKRLAEAYCQGLDQARPVDSISTTRFITVRFGNVLGSAGSVVPLFQRQIEAGGPVTVTHESITRYFMTIPEAVTLILQAGAQGIGRDSERGSIYVLDMGKPIKIIDLARQIIRLSGRRPDTDIQIKIIGLRAGEKLYEEVTHSDESVMETASKSVFKVAPRFTDLRIIQQQLQELRAACNGGDEERLLRVLNLAVPEFSRAAPAAKEPVTAPS